jgi:hypothetical protein
MRAANEQVVFHGGTGAQLTGALHLPPDVRGGVLLAGGHLLTDRQSAAQAVRIVAEWFDRTL